MSKPSVLAAAPVVERDAELPALPAHQVALQLRGGQEGRREGGRRLRASAAQPGCSALKSPAARWLHGERGAPTHRPGRALRLHHVKRLQVGAEGRLA